MTEDPVTRAPRRGPEADRRLRIARAIIMSTLAFIVVTVLALPLAEFASFFAGASPVAEGRTLTWWRPVAAEALLVVMVVLLFLLLRDRMDGRRIPDPRLYWGSLALVAASVLLLQTPVTGMSVVGAWWAIGAFLAPRRRTAAVTAGLVLLPWAALPLSPMDTHPAVLVITWVLMVLWALLLASGTLATLWLWDITAEAVEGQHARARLAVTEERLRFARDMHDLLGHSLSALAVKSELASRLAERDPARAAAEMTEVNELARQALQQVRSAVSGYREVSLADEVHTVGEVLSASGTRVRVKGLDGLELDPGQESLAAWVVREGGTNVLRHSDATECGIVFSRTEDAGTGERSLVVEVSNDRAHPLGGREGGSGNGLAGLSERVALGGGVLTSSRTRDGGFLLRAVLPL